MKFPLLSFSLCLALPGLVLPAVAQIVPDQTLGSENSTVQLNNPGQVQINGGAVRGSNLFHSFEQFNILEQQAAYFSNPSGIINILSRVTGSDPSHIFGTLGVLGNANLFLLNPNGILFGPNAKLDLNGNFVASTAESFLLPGGQEFSAIAPGAAPLLTVDVPVTVGLRFGSEATGAIANTGQLNTPENLTLVGRSVVNTGELVGTNVELLAVPETVGQVNIGLGGTLESVVPSEISQPIAVTGLPDTLPEDIGAIATIAGTTVVSGTIEANETVQALGDRVALTNADIKAKNIQVGGDYRGEGSVLNATRTVVDEGSTLTSERAIVWADDLTVMEGTINAPGGFVEVSGKEQLIFRGEIDAETILFDPRNITISSAPSSAGILGELPDIFARDFAATDITINASDLENQLGTVILEATNDIILADNLNFVSGGDITWIADSDNNGVGTINGTTQDIRTNGRDLTLIAAELENLEIRTEGGKLFIQSTHGDITGEKLESHRNNGLGDANDIEIRSTGNIDLEQIDASSSLGNAGEVNLIAGGDVRIREDIRTNSVLLGSAKDITIEAQGDIELSGNLITFGGFANGDISITSYNGSIDSEPSIFLTGDLNEIPDEYLELTSDNNVGITNLGNAFLSLFNTQDDGGDIVFKAAEQINLSSTVIIVSGSEGITNGTGTAGGSIQFQGVNGKNPDINLVSFLIKNDTFSGNAGDIQFRNINNLIIEQSFIEARNRWYANGSSPSVTINAIGEINILNNSAFNVGNSSVRPTGNLTIKAKGLTLVNSFLSVGTNSPIVVGEGGTLSIDVAEDIRIIGIPSKSRLLAELPGGIFNMSSGRSAAGTVFINAHNVLLEGHTMVTTLGSNDGGATGDININVRGTISIRDNSWISADTIYNEPGGDINLIAQNLILEDEGFITASTFNADSSRNTGNGGNLEILSDQIIVNNQSLIGTFSSNDGDAGDISISTKSLFLDDNSAITVSSDPFAADLQKPIERINQIFTAVEGSSLASPSSPTIITSGNGGGNAGNLNINANQIHLSNQSQIVGESSSGNGGNININAQDYLLLRHNSSISTTAGTAQAGGNGGNITINAPFIIGVPTENSDITANAFSGSGGNITINAVAIYGLGFRPFLTALSDITASSDLGVQGSVLLNLTGVDLNQSLTALPREPVNTEVAEGCQAIGRGATVDFIAVGGGYELSQSGAINTDGITARLLSLDLVDVPAGNGGESQASTASPKINVANMSIHNC
ncbi:MAG: filamentous hemagglutinin N-terminal domain-containing protein [Spirulina sp. SIO3F2]|nr:filamentous hemagglutinin N-terminal domain-containing protein [Spirulina sp. SIO3F2]